MLDSFTKAIYKKSPLQKKRLGTFLEEMDPLFWTRANTFAGQFERYLLASGLDIEVATDAYLKMCKDTLTEQTKFLRTGVYSCENQEAAYQNIYSNMNEMRSYMLGLALSQFLWKNHYAIYAYFLETMEKSRGKVQRYLEMGPGHGLFLAAALNHLGADQYTAIDISPVSLKICEEILPFLSQSHANPELARMNVFDIKQEHYDFITLGEIIEHVDDPRPLLRKIVAMIGDRGRAFITTCANCPAIDHVYLFRNVQEIRNLLNECGLSIETELVLPAEKLSAEDLERQKVAINYAAVLKAC